MEIKLMNNPQSTHVICSCNFSCRRNYIVVYIIP